MTGSPIGTAGEPQAPRPGGSGDEGTGVTIWTWCRGCGAEFPLAGYVDHLIEVGLQFDPMLRV